MTFREAIAVAVGLIGLVALQLVSTDSVYLLQKYFWTDELATYSLITDPDVGHALRAMQGSVDINPPGLHILLRAFTTLTNSTSEVALRSFALISIVTALVGLYAVLRDVYGMLVALTAALAVWSHPLILDHAFEVRYYGPWLAAAVWFCFLLGRARARALGSLGAVALGVVSFFLCTIHYFGIVTLVIVVASEWWWQRTQPMYARRALAAIAVGPLATIAAVVVLLPYQRAATTVTTWIPDPTVARIADVGTTVFLPLHLGAIVMVAWLSRLTTRREGPVADPPSLTRAPSGVIGLTSLALLVPALVAFSFVVQPVLISRYGLPAIGALAPAVAYAAFRMSKAWVVLLVAFLMASSAFGLRERSIRAQASDRDRQRLIQDIREHTGDDRVFFEAPHQLNVVWHYAEDLRGRLFLLDFERGELGDHVAPFRIWSRDLAREFVKYYDGPALLPWRDVKQTPTVFIVPHPEAYTREPAADERYVQFVMTPVRGQVQRLVRSDGR